MHESNPDVITSLWTVCLGNITQVQSKSANIALFFLASIQTERMQEFELLALYADVHIAEKTYWMQTCLFLLQPCFLK